jgi:hypothetical protein
LTTFFPKIPKFVWNGWGDGILTFNSLLLTSL